MIHYIGLYHMYNPILKLLNLLFDRYAVHLLFSVEVQSKRYVGRKPKSFLPLLIEFLRSTEGVWAYIVLYVKQ